MPLPYNPIALHMTLEQFSILSRAARIGLNMVGGGTNTGPKEIVELHNLITAFPDDLEKVKLKMANACQDAIKVASRG